MSFWSCAATKPQAEQVAIRNLRRQGFTAFFPFFLVRNKYRHYAVKPAFPGYVFVELAEDQNWSPINGTPGVRQLLTVVTKTSEYLQPCRVPFVGELRRVRVGPAEVGEVGGDLIPLGTMVRITRGPLAERVALVQMSTPERLRLLVDLFNRQVSVDIELLSVEVIAGPA